MSTITDAVFFMSGGKVVKQMLMKEFEALTDGVVQAKAYQSQRVPAVFLQINQDLNIKGLVFFFLDFTDDGHVDPDWGLPITQLIQSAGRGPDLGGGPVRVVCKSQCSLPWHEDNLWDPKKSTLQVLVQAVEEDELGIGEEEDILELEGWDDIPTVDTIPVTAEPPVLTPGEIPTIPVAEPAAKKAAPGGNDTAYQDLKKEYDAMQAALSVKLDRLQKERDALREKSKTLTDNLKEKAREQAESLRQGFAVDLAKKDEQIKALKDQLDNEQKRYAELKEQQDKQAAVYHADRESMMEKLEQSKEVAPEKIEELKQAFKKELVARIDAETARVNEKLAMREVEVFYREEQLNILQDELSQLKSEKQNLMKGGGDNILETLEDNGVTFVAFQVGVGHITLDIDDVGRFLDERNSYLAERAGVSEEVFNSWKQHYNSPVCEHIGGGGDKCGKSLTRVELAKNFVPGESDRCANHQPIKSASQSAQG